VNLCLLDGSQRVSLDEPFQSQEVSVLKQKVELEFGQRKSTGKPPVLMIIISYPSSVLKAGDQQPFCSASRITLSASSADLAKGLSTMTGDQINSKNAVHGVKEHNAGPLTMFSGFKGFLGEEGVSVNS
jgi:hypothetical protein